MCERVWVPAFAGKTVTMGGATLTHLLLCDHGADMGLASCLSQSGLALAFGVAGFLGLVAVVIAGGATDAGDIKLRGLILLAERHAAGVALAIVAEAEPMADRNALIKDETFAFPKAFGLRHRLQIFQYAAVEMIDLVYAFRLEEGCGFFAADAAGAEHGDLGGLYPAQ